MDVAAWLAHAAADADARGLPELKPLLESLARSTQALRDADRDFGHAAEYPAAESAAEYAENSDQHADDKGR